MVLTFGEQFVLTAKISTQMRASSHQIILNRAKTEQKGVLVSTHMDLFTKPRLEKRLDGMNNLK